MAGDEECEILVPSSYDSTTHECVDCKEIEIVCGDDRVAGDEECEILVPSSFDPTTHECVDCKEIELPSAICGNGIKEDSEYCDDNLNFYGCVPN